MSGEEKVLVTNRYRVEISGFDDDNLEESFSEADSSDENIFQQTDGKVVHWPPKSEEIEQEKLESSQTLKYSKFNSTQMEEQQQSYQRSNLATELFQPGKLKAEDRWKPIESTIVKPNEAASSEVVRRKFKSLEEVITSNGPMKQHTTYHVPPGTTRTRRAQENYTKHLKIPEINPQKQI